MAPPAAPGHGERPAYQVLIPNRSIRGDAQHFEQSHELARSLSQHLTKFVRARREQFVLTLWSC